MAHLLAALGKVKAGVGLGRSPNPREAHHEEKHCCAVSTHCSFTRDPPQKCWPCLENEG